MARWRELELYLESLLDEGQDKFTQGAVRDDLDLTGAEASDLIRSYLAAQRGTRSQTKYVLHRSGRTSATTWTVGVRTSDAREVTGQFMGDFRHRLDIAVEPDLRRIAAVNPRAGRLVERAIDLMFAQIETTVGVLVASNAIDTDSEQGTAA